MKQKGNVMMDQAQMLERLRLETFCMNVRAHHGEQLYLFNIMRYVRPVVAGIMRGEVEYASWHTQD